MNDDVSTWQSISLLAVFFLTNLAVMFPIRVVLPNSLAFAMQHCLPSVSSNRRFYLYLDHRTVPPAVVLIFLAAGVLDTSDVQAGILGANGIKPIDIMALFLSLAYMAISLDATGLLRFLAFLVAKRGGASGRRLYLYLYTFFLACGVIVGNDPVVLSGTAFIAYLTRVAGIVPPTAWIFAQFAAANLASAVLVSSNPTNLVLTGAFGISFTSYTAHIIIPVMCAALTVYPVLRFFLFASSDLIPDNLNLDFDNLNRELTEALVDKGGAIVGASLLIITLAILVGTSTIGVPVWEVTVPPAVIMLIRDIWHDLSHQCVNLSLAEPDNTTTIQLQELASSRSTAVSSIRSSPHVSSTGLPSVSTPPTGNRAQQGRIIVLRSFSERFPTVRTVLRKLPTTLVLFGMSMFILVQGLLRKGWIELFSSWWELWVQKAGTIGAIGGMGLISCLLCNICGTNIGCTILLARMLQFWINASPPILPRTRTGAVYALALGSNFGAITFSFSASLAGLLWRDILRSKGIRISGREFAKLNFPVVAVAMTAACATLLGEVYIWV